MSKNLISWRPSWILAINGKPGRGFFGHFTWAITRLSRTTVRSLSFGTQITTPKPNISGL